MHTYRLFVIQNEAWNLYLKKPAFLFHFLKKLYHFEEKNLQYGLSLYLQLCTPIHVKLLSNYIIEKVPAIKIQKNTFKMLSFFENTIIELHYANIIVQTNETIPSIFQILKIYSEHILVCDFNKNQYFWLTDALKKVETIGQKHI